MAISPSAARSRRRWLALVAAVLLAAAGLAWRPASPQASTQPGRPTHPGTDAASRPKSGLEARLKGVNWVGADSLASYNLEPLIRAHVTWIAQTPFGWQPGAATPEIRLHTSTGSRSYWGESDRGLAQTARQARQRGIRTMLKPHLWLRGPGGTWPGDIRMSSEADWKHRAIAPKA